MTTEKDTAYQAWLALGQNYELGKFAVTPVAFGAGFDAGKAQQPTAETITTGDQISGDEQSAWHAGLDEGRAQGRASASEDKALLDWFQQDLKRDGEIHLADGSTKTVNAWAIASDGDDLRAALRAARDQAMKALN